MAENRHSQHEHYGKGIAPEKHIPSTDGENTAPAEPPSERSPREHEPGRVQKGIADADKKARTGSTDEAVRDTPPAGAWNDTSGD